MRRNPSLYLPLLAVGAPLLAALIALPAVAATLMTAAPGLDTVTMGIAGAPWMIERPADWQEGGVRGLGIVHSYIGDVDGLPAFSVQHDPGSRLAETATTADLEAAVEELFGAIVAGRPGYHVEHAGWVRINGMRVHSSLTAYGSVAGPMMVRRLILTHDGAPFIFAWTAEVEEWARVSAMIERCVASLRPRAPEIVAALP